MKDYFIINDGNRDVIIYPLLEIENDKSYLIYSKSMDISGTNDMFVGEITKENKLLPIDDNMIKVFDDYIVKVFNYLKSRDIV